MLEKVKAFMREQAITNPKVLIFLSVNLVCLLGVGFLIVIEVVMKYEQTGLLGISAIFACILATFIMASLYPEKVNLLSNLILYPLNLVMFPLLFVFGEGAGISSAMPIWFLFGILMNFILLDGINCLVLLILTCIADVASMLVAYVHPELTNYVATQFYYYMDNSITIILVAISVGFIMKYEKYIDRMYKRSLKESEQKVIEERNKAIKANKAKTTFLTNISHDVRTPLTDIMAMCANGEAHISDPDKVHEAFVEIVNYSLQLLYFFDNTINLAEIESGSLSIKTSRFNLPELISYIESTANKTAELNNISFVLQIEENNEIFLEGDSSKVRQIIMLILDNSFKYTKGGGKVTLGVSRIYEHDDGKHWYRFTIIDNGIGMSYEFIEDSLFEAYVRGNEDYVKNISGSGIGMSIVKSLLEVMNGKIKVKSEKGKGTTITVDIPFEKDKLSDTQMNNRVLFSVNKNIEVLIVDDDEVAVNIISKMLEKIGVVPICCKTAEEAIELLKNSKQNRFKLALFDIILPGMDGYSAARTIRSLDREDLSNLPIIAVTANAYSLAEEKSVLSGMNEYISKPIEVTEFYQKIYRYLAKYSV